MSGQQLVLEDKVSGHRFESDEFHNEIRVLHTLYGGLSFLNAQVKHLEDIISSSTRGKGMFGFSANLEETFGLPQGANVLTPCFYHWFGVSIVNFVRKVGLLDGIKSENLTASKFLNSAEKRKISKYCGAYTRSVSEIADAYVWRNKVFAHFADTDPYESDNDALIQQVSFYPITFAGGKLEVGGFQAFTGTFDPSAGPSAAAQGSGLPNWSLTQVYEKFASRYVFELAPSRLAT